MLRRIAFLLFFLVGFSAFAAKKYASPNGNPSNSGDSESAPWSLSFALSSASSLVPGDSLLLMDGVYEGNYVSEISGTSGSPIRILAINPGAAIIDIGKNRTAETALRINGNNTWFIGLHITSSSTIRKSDASNGNATVLYESGIAVFGDNNKLINCWVYDVVGGGLELWRSGLNLEVYGCVIFNNGSQGTTRGTGHGMYIQHDELDFPKVIRNNFVFQNASQGINIYTTNPPNGGVIVDRNVSFNSGVIADFNSLLSRPPHNLTVGSRNNISIDMRFLGNIFYADFQGGRLNKDIVRNVTLGRTFFPNSDFRFIENRIYGGGSQVELVPLTRLEFRGNTLFNTQGSFIDLLGTDKTYTAANWDLNTYVNLSGESEPFDDLNFSDWKSTFGFDSGSQLLTSPENSVETLVTKNAYEPNVYYVTILNFGGSDQVSVDFIGQGILSGQNYEIIDVQNPFDNDQKVEGAFNGSTIQFPMNWTESLQPKGNMPHQVVHTDNTFGTFILRLQELENVEFPEIKDSVSVFVNQDGIANLTSELFLVNPPAEAFEFSSSRGFIFNCLDLGKNEVILTATNKQTNEKETTQISLYVTDSISPSFTSTDANLDFDLVLGKVSLKEDDFEVENFEDNCSTEFTVALSEEEITCDDIDEESGVAEFPVLLTVFDASGNKTDASAKVNLTFIESQKISLNETVPLFQGQSTEIKLGDELGYEVLEWFRNGTLLQGLKGNVIEIEEPGNYFAKVMLESGCIARSQMLTVVLQEAEFPVVRKEIALELDEQGSVSLTGEDLFETWPLEDEGITIEISKETFTCTELGVNEVTVTLTNADNVVSEQKTEISIQDNIAPEFTPLDLELTLDLSLGSLTLDAADFYTDLVDNCEIRSISINRESITCEDIGNVIPIEIRVEDSSGNVTEQTADLSIIGASTKPVVISGENEICTGSETRLTLSSDASFEVIRWRRNGEEIDGETGTSLIIEEAGEYDAVIRFEGACLDETEKFLVEESSLPSGEISVSGFTLTAPEGDVSYQWTRNEEIIPSATSQSYLVSTEGSYSVILRNEEGCERVLASVVFSQEDLDTPFSKVKEEVIATLDENGNVVLSPEDVFTSWPPTDPNLIITLSESSFTCNDLGDPIGISIRIEDQSGQVWERLTQVIVIDDLAPLLELRDAEFDFDLVTGVLELSPDDFIVTAEDNCGIEDITMNQRVFTCEDLGEAISIEITASDASGNITVKVASLRLNTVSSAPVSIGGALEFCVGAETELTLNSDAEFEIIRWRRNGQEIAGERGKTLVTGEPGGYHAVIRYAGGCLTETEIVTVSVQAFPSGEIKEEGSTLVAPEGDFTYQWYRDDVVLVGETDRIIQLDEMGTYTVDLTSSAGCIANLGPVVVTISGIFSSSKLLSEKLKIYPNPAKDIVQITIESDHQVDLETLQIYSLEGKNVTDRVRIELNGLAKVKMEIGKLSAGTFIITLETLDRKVFVGKLIKE